MGQRSNQNESQCVANASAPLSCGWAERAVFRGSLPMMCFGLRNRKMADVSSRWRKLSPSDSASRHRLSVCPGGAVSRSFVYTPNLKDGHLGASVQHYVETVLLTPATAHGNSTSRGSWSLVRNVALRRKVDGITDARLLMLMNVPPTVALSCALHRYNLELRHGSMFLFVQSDT